MAQDGIKFGITDVEGVVAALELLVFVEKERERIIDAYQLEMAAFRIDMETKNPRREPSKASFPLLVDIRFARSTAGFGTPPNLRVSPVPYSTLETWRRLWTPGHRQLGSYRQAERTASIHRL